MSNEKMIIVYTDYGSNYKAVYPHVHDNGIELCNSKLFGMTISWVDTKYNHCFHNLKSDECFQIWDYDEATYNRILKEINNG